MTYIGRTGLKPASLERALETILDDRYDKWSKHRTVEGAVDKLLDERYDLHRGIERIADEVEKIHPDRNWHTQLRALIK